MNKDNDILKFLLASIIALGVVVGIIYLFVWDNNNKLHGKLVFTETFNKGNDIDKIELLTSEEKVVLNQKNSYWTVENRNNYYADFTMINTLLNSLNKSIYSIRFPYVEETEKNKYLKNPAKVKENSGILIRTFVNDKKIDEIIVGLSDESKNYHFARNLKDDNIWLISENFNVPIYSKDWIMRPIVSVPVKQIETVQIDDREIERLDEYSLFSNEKGIATNISVLTDILSRLLAVDAITEDDFVKNIKNNVKKKNIKISTFVVLVFDLEIYSADKKVWCKINLSTTSLPMKVVNDYINDNRFLYDGWYFEISSEQGHILRDFRLW